MIDYQTQLSDPVFWLVMIIMFAVCHYVARAAQR